MSDFQVRVVSGALEVITSGWIQANITGDSIKLLIQNITLVFDFAPDRFVHLKSAQQTFAFTLNRSGVSLKSSAWFQASGEMRTKEVHL